MQLILDRVYLIRNVIFFLYTISFLFGLLQTINFFLVIIILDRNS
jgi:hypothetical protein